MSRSGSQPQWGGWGRVSGQVQAQPGSQRGDAELAKGGPIPRSDLR